MSSLRLGDVIDDYCVKCRRLTNHAIVSLVDGAASKVRCRTCYHDHDYRHEQPPPSKKDLKKAELFNQVLANAGGATDGVAADAPVVVPVDGTPVETAEPGEAPEPVEAPEPIEAPEPVEAGAATADTAGKKRARKSTK
jgi:hypothetical protein